MNETINGKNPRDITKEEALDFCYKHADAFKAKMYTFDINGATEFGCIIAIVDAGTIKPHEIVNYGMSDQEFED